MRISLMYEIQRAPGGADYYNKAYREAIDQVVLADQAGFHAVWTTEHHFLVDFCASPSHEAYYGFLAARTKRIRLGTGVVILPYHHPVMVAERIATLDIVSEGRVEFGTGRGGSYEQTAWGVDPRNAFEMWDESLRCIAQLWQTNGEFSWEGKHWKFPPRRVLPTPYQKPHPRIWNACIQTVSIQDSAERGIGVLHFNFRAPEFMAEHVSKYRETIQKVRPYGAFANNQFVSFSGGYCDTDNRQARELSATAVKTFFGPGKPYAAASAGVVQDLLKQWNGVVPDRLARAFSRVASGQPSGQQAGVGGLVGQAATLGNVLQELDADTLCDNGTVVAGDPESCIKALEMHEKVGADEVMINMQNVTIPHEKVMKSIEMYGKHIIPYFQRKARSSTKAPGASLRAIS